MVKEGRRTGHGGTGHGRTTDRRTDGGTDGTETGSGRTGRTDGRHTDGRDTDGRAGRDGRTSNNGKIKVVEQTRDVSIKVLEQKRLRKSKLSCLEQTSLGKILEEGRGMSSADANGPFGSVDVLLPI